MSSKYPANTQTIRNLKETFIYFLVVKEEEISNDIPQSEYFIYRFIVPVSASDGKKQLNNYLSKNTEGKVSVCREVSYNEYAVGDFPHPTYKNNQRLPLKIKMRDLPIYLQSSIRVIDFNKDKYQYGSKPIYLDGTGFNSEVPVKNVLDTEFVTRAGGNKIN